VTMTCREAGLKRTTVPREFGLRKDAMPVSGQELGTVKKSQTRPGRFSRSERRPPRQKNSSHEGEKTKGERRTQSSREGCWGEKLEGLARIHPQQKASLEGEKTQKNEVGPTQRDLGAKKRSAILRRSREKVRPEFALQEETGREGEKGQKGRSRPISSDQQQAEGGFTYRYWPRIINATRILTCGRLATEFKRGKEGGTLKKSEKQIL